ncbi:MAG: GHKL domain-containing protein [Clostridia bacterium]|nr:GHKL domain-containing protein [Clostridia bacterium]
MSLFIELLVNLFDSVIGAYFVLKLNKGKVRENKAFLPVAALCFAVSTVFLFVNVFSLIHTLLITAILLAYAFSLKTHTVPSAILSVVIYELTLALSSVAVAFLLSNLFDIEVTAIASGFTLARCLFLLSCKLIVGAVLLSILKFYTPNRYFKPIDLVLYLVAPLITIITLSTFLILSINEQLGQYYTLFAVCSVGLVVTNVFSLVLFVRQTKNENEKHEMEMLLRLRESELQRHNDSQKHYESMRILRHDIKEQILYVKLLVEKGELNAAKEHIDALEGIVNDNRTVCTGNRIIDSILYYKTAMNPDIRFIVSGTIGDLNTIGDVELVSLLTNMLDNAIEASERQDEKIIELVFSLIGGFQNISCKNPIKQSIASNPDLATTKPDKSLHGYGIKSMKKAVESANGMIEFYEEDGYFICHAAIPLG